MAVIASFVIGANDATSKNGLSAGLSTPADRARFLERHRSASAFIIGKESARKESYSGTRVPIFVISRSGHGIELADSQMKLIQVEDDLAKKIFALKEEIAGDIVVEAGAELLLALVEAEVIEELELTLSPIEGDGNFIDRTRLLRNFHIESDVNIEGTRLLKCRYHGNSANS